MSAILLAMIGTRERALFISLVSAAAVMIAVACGDEESEAETPERPSAQAEPEAPVEEPRESQSEAFQRALARTRVHLDLLALAHLADVDHHGVYVDFGTPARMHYTMGRWHNGFTSDESTGERTFTRMGEEGRVYVQVDQASALTLRLRGRSIGADSLVVYVNGQRAGQVDFEGNGVQEHDVAVDRSLVVAGENEIRLRGTGTRTVGGEEVAAELDSLWVMPQSLPSGELEAPVFGELVRELTVGGQARRALVVRGPTSVRWYAAIPEGAKLALGVGGSAAGGTAQVLVTPAGDDTVELFEAEVDTRWNDQLLDLAQFAGKVVRIELSVDAGAEVGFSGPAVVVPLPETALADAPEAKSAIVVLIDTMRASKLKPYNPETRVRTPAFDAFAAEGALFEHAQAPENWTKPSVASVLTSLTPMTHNTKRDESSLPQSALMVSEVFKEAGFSTASFIANGYVSDRFGFDQGWDHYTNYIREERNTRAENVFDEAIEWIEAHKDTRFFAYVHTIDPHVPYDPPEDILRIYDPDPYSGPIRPRRTAFHLEDFKTGELTLTDRDKRRLEALYDGDVDYHDRHFARFVERLKELGLYDDVVFVITADHGEEFLDHGSYGHGHSIYQELLHVPLVMRWKNVIAPRRISPTVSTMDVAPTILEATGVDIPEEFEGHSLLDTARGHMRAGPAIAFSDKLDDRRVATSAGYKLVIRGNLTWSFFDLREDPGEQEQIDDPSRKPIALRYLRVLMGQFLGASDRGDWLHGGTGGESRVLPQAESEIDRDLCLQLKALGYHDSRCANLL